MDQPGHMMGHKPLMNLGMQSVSSATSNQPCERMIPRAFNHKNAFVLMPVNQIAAGPANKAKAASTKASKQPRAQQSNGSQRMPVFQHLTMDTMKMRFGRTPPPGVRTEDNEDSLPPSKRHRTDNVVPMLPKKPLLRPSQPLKNSDEVDVDIWQNILGFCDPKFLLEAKTINSFFYKVLSSRQSIWRKSRQYHYGHDMPDCPGRLTEQRYVDLLVGRGCQSNTCTRQNTVKVYWTFLGRLCTDCLARKTIRAEDLANERRHTILDPSGGTANNDVPSPELPLWTALPMAASNGRRYLHARAVDETQTRWETDSHSCYLFLKSDYLKLEAEHLALQQKEPSTSEVKEWWQKKVAETIAYMVESSKLELWHHAREIGRRDIREERRQFFQFEAANLSPPMSPAVLQSMAAYQKALNSNNPPSTRAWTTLKAKILPYRRQAEALVQHQVQMNSLESCPAIDLFRRLHTHRSGRRQDARSLRPEQQAVLKIAAEEFEACLSAGVADSDLVLLCLKNVFERYEKCENRPSGLNYDGTVGSYKLSMDDARMIVEEVMEERISRFSQRGGAIFESFKCAGCVRKDYCRRWSFNQAFEHILLAHSQLVGQGFEFWRYAIPFPRDHEHEKQYYRFPWYTVPWPRCLPLLPEHREAADLPSWDPEATLDYVQVEKTGTHSAFDGRFTCESNIAKNDFGGNLIFAAKALDGVRLSNPCLTKIALQYALSRYMQESATTPPLATFLRAIPSARDANPAMDFKYKCGHCKSEGKVYRSARQVKYFIPIEQLQKHWLEKHKALNWTIDFLDLPSDTEVYDQIVESDRKLLEEKEAVRSMTLVVPTSNKKRPNVKANVILGTTLAMDAFDKLFVQAG